MKRLIIDGCSVYEIDLDCVERRKPPEECEVSQHLDKDIGKKAQKSLRNKVSFVKK